jgi:PHD-zinc-finger like domain/PHD-finger
MKQMIQSTGACVLCNTKIENLNSIEYYPEHFAHLQCIEQKTCIFCGNSSMCVKCEHKDCTRTFHHHCFSKYFPQKQNDHSFLCDLHTKAKGKRKEYNKVWATRQIANRAAENLDAIKKIKETQGDNKAFSICTGQVFWYIIGSQYFSNFIKLTKPDIQLNYLIDYQDTWESDIDDYINNLSTQYHETQQNNVNLIKDVAQYKSLRPETLKDYKEEDIILSETRNLLLREGFEEYLKYFESKAKEETDASGSTEKRISSLREVPKNEEDFVCSICGDGDYEDDDLIVICSKCEMGAHMKCYGIPVVPDTDWYCHGCSGTDTKEERLSLRCALCPIKGGCIKPTIHTTRDNLSFPNYPEGKNELVWCHVFCAVHVDLGVFGNKENLTEINLKNIDPKRFTLKCQVCKTKDGACLQCQHGRCQASFHPECGKDYFTNTRDKTGYDEVSIYCPLHKPLKLRRVLEGKEKKCVEDIISFSKAFLKYERKIKNYSPLVPFRQTTLNEKPFTYNEKTKFIFALEKEIKNVSNVYNTEFSWIIKLKSASLRNNIEVVKPQYYNILDPQAILNNKITIPGRKAAECHKLYLNYLHGLLKQELALMNLNSSTYFPRLKNKTKKKERVKNQEKYIQTYIDVPVLNDVATTEVYCICKKPFIEKSSKKPWESEFDYAIREIENKMVYCENCTEWYHYKCIGFKSDSEVPENYFCAKCSEISANNVVINN